MAPYQITLNDEILKDLFNSEKGMAVLLEQVFNQILQAQAGEQLQAERYERTEDRQGYRNGTYPHTLTTRVGTITLRVPRLRNGQFSTDLFSRYQRSEQALVLALLEMVVNGVSTRKITKVTEELHGTEFSKSTVSDLCKRLDPIVHAWNNRNLRDNPLHTKHHGCLPKSLQSELHGRLRVMLEAPDSKTARGLVENILEDFEAKVPKAMKVLEDGFDDATAVLELPEKYRKRLRTTNGVTPLP